MKPLKDYPLKELKLIYNILHVQLPLHITLLESELLQDLQRYLLSQATTEGVDVSKSTEWTRWLNNHMSSSQ